VLKKAKRWHLFADEIHPLPVRQNVGRALAHEDKLRLLRTSAARPEWQTAAWAAGLALNTTMRGCEIKGLCWRDVDMMERTITIRNSKTEAGERVLPLNADAWAVILELYERAKTMSAVEGSHYLFFSCEVAKVDPNRPMKSWRTAWRRLTRAVTCPACRTLQDPGQTCTNGECGLDIVKQKSPFAGLRFHDLRHAAITELAEKANSDSVIRSIAGHVSPKC